MEFEDDGVFDVPNGSTHWSCVCVCVCVRARARARAHDMALLALALLLCYMPTFWLVDCKSLAHSMMPQWMKSSETIVFIQVQLTYVPIRVSLFFKCTVFVKRIVNLLGLWPRVALAASLLIELWTYLLIM
jgi:hypothetical protein